MMLTHTHCGRRRKCAGAIGIFGSTDSTGMLRKMSRNVPDGKIMMALCGTMQIRNQKNGWKNVCINQEHNGHSICCGVRALGGQYINIRDNTSSYEEAQKTYLSAYWIDGKRFDVTNQDISAVLREAARALQYLEV